MDISEYPMEQRPLPKARRNTEYLKKPLVFRSRLRKLTPKWIEVVPIIRMNILI